jgi:hypothetical protein
MHDAQPTPLDSPPNPTVVPFRPTRHPAGPDTSSIDVQIGASSTEPR